MKDIEIILIDDNSKDDSIEIISRYMEKDKRIILIENKENRKILFSKSIGALKSRGKYIIELDQDDMFINDFAFDMLYNETEINNDNIIRFEVIYGNMFHKPKLNNLGIKVKIYKQPELRFFMFKINKGLLWGNIIKADLYKKVIYNLWPIIINYQIIFQEDYLITFFLLIHTQKFKQIDKKLLFHFKNKKSASNRHKTNSEYYLSVIFIGIIYYDYYFTLSPQDLKIMINYIYFLKNDFKKIKILYPSIFNYYFGKILTNNKLLDKDKDKIKKYFDIPENCDSYKYLTINKSLILNNFPFKNAKNIPKKYNIKFK